MKAYILGIDQSTQGTKALLFDEEGTLCSRIDISHEQKINEDGWVSHDQEEIYENTIQAAKTLIEHSGIDKCLIKGIGISNQRETSAVWNKETGRPVCDAIVWQCARAAAIAERVESNGHAEAVRERTGLNLSPYFPASKLAWILENIDGARALAESEKLCCGTMDSWLIYKLTQGKSFKTDYSNASRTQLFNIFKLKWDEEVCNWFGIPPICLPQVCDSDSCFGESDLNGLLESAIPIYGVLGDSHGSLFGQGCLRKGMIKSTYGTGSSIMMNIGEEPVLSNHGVVTSLAWGMSGTVQYVLEGNINYTGAVITWLKDDLGLIHSPKETEALARAAKADDELYLVPAFTGLGAPYWNSHAKASLTGITRTTRRAEIVRAGVECIAYQITDVIQAMSQDAGIPVTELRVDGGPTGNAYLMQFQSDIADAKVQVPNAEELSGIGAAYAAGIALGIYDKEIFQKLNRLGYEPNMDSNVRTKKYEGWKKAVGSVLAGTTC